MGILRRKNSSGSSQVIIQPSVISYFDESPISVDFASILNNGNEVTITTGGLDLGKINEINVLGSNIDSKLKLPALGLNLKNTLIKINNFGDEVITVYIGDSDYEILPKPNSSLEEYTSMSILYKTNEVTIY